MNKLAIAFVALAFVTISTISQASNPQPALPKCNLTEATAPSVRGLRLGMSTQQLLALFPDSSKRKEMNLRLAHREPETAPKCSGHIAARRHADLHETCCPKCYTPGSHSKFIDAPTRLPSKEGFSLEGPLIASRRQGLCRAAPGTAVRYVSFAPDSVQS